MNDIGSAAAQGLGGNPELAAAFDDFIHSFEQFKDANDDRLSQIERRTSADVITGRKGQSDRPRRRRKQAAPLINSSSNTDVRPWTATRRSPPTSWSINPGLMPICAQARNRVCGKSSRSHSPPDRIPMAVFWCPKNCRAKLAGVWPQISPIRAPVDGSADIVLHLQKNRSLPQERKLDGLGETDNRPETSTPTLAELQFQAMENLRHARCHPRTA